MSRHFLILPCQYLEPESGVFVLGTRAGLVRLHDPVAAACVGRLLDLGWGETLSNERLTALVNEARVRDSQAFIDFLVETGVLRPVAAPWRRFQTLRVIHWPAATVGDPELLQEDLAFFTGIPAIAAGVPTAVSHDEFVVLHLRTYDPDVIDFLQRQVRAARTAAMITAYYAGRTQVIDAPFVPAAATPCHFCQTQVSRIPRTATSRLAPTWMQAIGAMGMNPSAISGLEYPLRPSDYLLGQVLLRNRISELLSPQWEPLHAGVFFQAIQTNLDDLVTQRDTPPIQLDCDRCAPY